MQLYTLNWYADKARNKQQIETDTVLSSYVNYALLQYA